LAQLKAASGLTILADPFSRNILWEGHPETIKLPSGAILDTAGQRELEDNAARLRAMEEYLASETDEEHTVRLSIDALVAYLAKSLLDPLGDTNERISYQIALCVSFVRMPF
jgi:hypothetical protein